MYSGTNLALSSDVDQEIFKKVKKHTRKQKTQARQEVSSFLAGNLMAARNRQDSITKTNMKHN